MDAILIIGLILGAIITPPLRRMIVSSTPFVAVVVPLAMSLYGVLPAILISIGAIHSSAFRGLMSLVYFVAFSVIASVALNGARSRAEHERDSK